MIDPVLHPGEQRIYGNESLRVTLAAVEHAGRAAYYLAAVELRTPAGWSLILAGRDGYEFSTSLGAANATECRVGPDGAGGWRLALSVEGEEWTAQEIVSLPTHGAALRREQAYRWRVPVVAAVHPGWRLPTGGDLRYTFPLHAHNRPLARLTAMRADVTWALPLPCHVWHNRAWTALYGVDRTRSAGTIDFMPLDEAGAAARRVPGDGSGGALVRVYYPDTTGQTEDLSEQAYKPPFVPETTAFAAGSEITLAEVIAAKPLRPGEEGLLEAERLAAGLLLAAPARPADLPAVAAGIAGYFRHCELWEPDALGPGRGWFLNMWVYTQCGTPRKRGSGSGYFDLGWGEGIAVETILGLVRYWKRTGQADLLSYVDEMTRNIELFRRGPGPAAAYYDRSDGREYGDFLLGKRIWTHSLGHTGSQLLQCYLATPDYPKPVTRRRWLDAAQSIAEFLAARQRPGGDVQDIFDEDDRAVNVKRHRVTARAVVCGLWARLSEVIGEPGYLQRAETLARAVAPEIESYDFYDQMIDGMAAPVEMSDGESAYYALEGLVPLYEATHDPAVLALCQKAAAFGICWTYFYDVPNAYRGIARGGQVCRMPDFPLLYPIGPAKAVEPLLGLARVTGDDFYRNMAREMVTFIGHYQLDAAGRPWHGGMVHAIDQHSGRHWGPDKCGQVDSGMSTGNSLAAIELWLAQP